MTHTQTRIINTVQSRVTKSWDQVFELSKKIGTDEVFELLVALEKAQTSIYKIKGEV
jgi:hypothetical protein